MIWHCRAIRPRLRWKFFILKMSQSYFLCDRKVENFHGMNCLFLQFLILLYMFAIKKLLNILKWPNPEIFKLHNIRGWSQILEFHISYQFFLELMCYTNIRKDENKLSIIDLTSYSQSDHILGENSLQLVLNMSQSYFLCDSWKVEHFHGMNCFFLHCHAISYFIIHVCNQKINKHSEMTKSWNFQTSPYQKLKSNFRVSHLIPIFLGLMCYTKIKKRRKQVKHHWFDIIQPIRPHLRWKFITIRCEICHNLIFYVTVKVEHFHGMNCFFLHSHPISYFIIHVSNQKIDEHSEMTKSWNF